MSDLLSILSLGSAGIAAQNTGVSVAANNVANANTQGYSRQRVDLESMLAAPLVGGVRSGSPQRVASDLLASRMRTASGSLGMSKAYSEALSDFEAVSTAGATIDTQLASVFTAMSQASVSPTDPAARDGVVASLRGLVSGINMRAGQVAAARGEADHRIADGAAQATALASQLAAANAQVAKSGDPTARDLRDQLANQLASLTGAHTRTDADGMMRVTLDGGAVLVDGAHAATMTATTDPATGFGKLEVVDGAVRRDVTAQLGGGSMGADLQLRDHTLATTAQQLDQLAYDTATGFDAVHTTNAALDGTTGHRMFGALAGVAGAAAALVVDPALSASSANLALGTVGNGPGDNAGAVALFQLAGKPVAAGGKTLGDAALAIVADVGRAGATAKGDVLRDELVNTHLGDLRDSLSGVDTQEELTNLSKFQHASEAMTKVVSTVDQLLGSLIQNL